MQERFDESGRGLGLEGRDGGRHGPINKVCVVPMRIVVRSYFCHICLGSWSHMWYLGVLPLRPGGRPVPNHADKPEPLVHSGA